MTTVATSRKIVTSIMTLELLESPELDIIDFCYIYMGGSRISRKGSVYMCLVVTCWEKADLLALVSGV